MKESAFSGEVTSRDKRSLSSAGKMFFPLEQSGLLLQGPAQSCFSPPVQLAPDGHCNCRCLQLVQHEAAQGMGGSPAVLVNHGETGDEV